MGDNCVGSGTVAVSARPGSAESVEGSDVIARIFCPLGLFDKHGHTPFRLVVNKIVLEDHAHVVQAGDEAAGRSSAAAGAVAEADDVGAVLPAGRQQGKPFGVVSEGNKPGLAVGVISH